VTGKGSRTIGSQHLALRDQVLQELRTRIINGEYQPGERLTEDRLADDFGVSRNPVREALRTVEAEGFVSVLPRRGAIVASPDESTISDLFAVRGSLETLAAQLAAERATPEDVEHLRGLLEGARRATDREDFTRVAELNSQLHLRVIEISGNRWLTSISQSLYQHVHWVFRIGAADRAPHSWIEHIRLVDAIESGDPAGAARAASDHVAAAAAAATENTSAAVAATEKNTSAAVAATEKTFAASERRTEVVVGVPLSGPRHNPASLVGSPQRPGDRSAGRG